MFTLNSTLNTHEFFMVTLNHLMRRSWKMRGLLGQTGPEPAEPLLSRPHPGEARGPLEPPASRRGRGMGRRAEAWLVHGYFPDQPESGWRKRSIEME